MSFLRKSKKRRRCIFKKKKNECIAPHRSIFNFFMMFDAIKCYFFVLKNLQIHVSLLFPFSTIVRKVAAVYIVYRLRHEPLRFHRGHFIFKKDSTTNLFSCTQLLSSFHQISIKWHSDIKTTWIGLHLKATKVLVVPLILVRTHYTFNVCNF